MMFRIKLHKSSVYPFNKKIPTRSSVPKKEGKSTLRIFSLAHLFSWRSKTQIPCCKSIIYFHVHPKIRVAIKAYISQSDSIHVRKCRSALLTGAPAVSRVYSRLSISFLSVRLYTFMSGRRRGRRDLSQHFN